MSEPDYMFIYWHVYATLRAAGRTESECHIEAFQTCCAVRPSGGRWVTPGHPNWESVLQASVKG